MIRNVCKAIIECYGQITKKQYSTILYETCLYHFFVYVYGVINIKLTLTSTPSVRVKTIVSFIQLIIET